MSKVLKKVNKNVEGQHVGLRIGQKLLQKAGEKLFTPNRKVLKKQKKNLESALEGHTVGQRIGQKLLKKAGKKLFTSNRSSKISKPSTARKIAKNIGKAGKTAMSAAILYGRLNDPRNQVTMVKKGLTGKGWVLPGNKYIGPGNPLESGEPANRDDANARIHDYDYDNYLKHGVKKKDLYLGYSDADKRLLDKTSTTTPEGIAITLGIGSKKLANKFGLNKRIRDEDVFKKLSK